MAFARPSITTMRTILARRGSVAITRATTRTLGQRSYASEAHGSGHHQAKAGSDLPWIIGSIGFTVPACAYLLSGSSDGGHHNVHEAAHKVKHAVEENVPKSTDGAKEKASEVADKAKSKASEAVDAAKEKYEEVKNSDAEDTKEKAKKTYESAKEKASSAAEGAKEKVSSTAEGAKEKASSKAEGAKEKTSEAKEAVKETVSDAKEKATTDSDKKPRRDTDTPPSHTDPADASKDPKNMNEMSGKQEGLSNAATFHSTLGTERGREISKKPEGSVQSGKLKGAVDPSR